MRTVDVGGPSVSAYGAVVPDWIAEPPPEVVDRLHGREPDDVPASPETVAQRLSPSPWTLAWVT